MKIHRIFAMVLRYWYYLTHSWDRLSDMFYWPTVDLLLWGLTSKYVQNQAGEVPQVVLIIISGILFWIIVWRGQYEITVNFLEELWNKNLVNIFVAPLKIREWVAAVFIIGIIKMALSLTFASILAYFLYQTNLLNFGFYLIPFAASLLLTGWVVGLIITGVIVRFGTKLQTLAWTAVMLVAPFSAVYYPLSVLPNWAQNVAKLVPASYIFENGRQLIMKGTVQWPEIAFSFILNLLYLLGALWFLQSSFRAARNKGLISLF